MYPGVSRLGVHANLRFPGGTCIWPLHRAHVCACLRPVVYKAPELVHRQHRPMASSSRQSPPTGSFHQHASKRKPTGPPGGTPPAKRSRPGPGPPATRTCRRCNREKSCSDFVCRWCITCNVRCLVCHDCITRTRTTSASFYCVTCAPPSGLDKNGAARGTPVNPKDADAVFRASGWMEQARAREDPSRQYRLTSGSLALVRPPSPVPSTGL